MICGKPGSPDLLGSMFLIKDCAIWRCRRFVPPCAEHLELDFRGKRRLPKTSYARIADGAELLLTVRTYSITSSARASSVGGMAMPSTFAVFWLMTNWNFVGC